MTSATKDCSGFCQGIFWPWHTIFRIMWILFVFEDPKPSNLFASYAF